MGASDLRYEVSVFCYGSIETFFPIFLRGFIFPGIYSTGLKKTAIVFSSFLFGIYHMAIFKTWFSIPLTIPAVVSLIITGMIFNYINLKNRNFLNSWIIHIFADSAIILIGIKMFYFS